MVRAARPTLLTAKHWRLDLTIAGRHRERRGRNGFLRDAGDLIRERHERGLLRWFRVRALVTLFLARLSRGGFDSAHQAAESAAALRRVVFLRRAAGVRQREIAIESHVRRHKCYIRRT